MANDGKKVRLDDSSEKNFGLYHPQVFQNPRSEGEKQGLMEAEDRGFSDLYRNTSEDFFLKSLMETSIGLPTPTMEMLGFKNLSQGFRTDSEELFNCWLTNEENHGYSPSSKAHHTRQASRRISTENSNLSYHQHGGLLQKKRSSDILFAQNTVMADEISGDIRNAVERGLQASNLYLAKAWFHSSQPMTRSRSSELRRSMLKGTLERKKLSNQIEKKTFEEFSDGHYQAQEVANSSFHHGHENHNNEMQGTLQELSSGRVKDPGVLETIQGYLDLDLEGFVNPTNTIHVSTFSREPSQSESSAAAPVVSSGFDAWDGPSNSSQTLSICESSRRQVGNGRNSENASRAKDFREQIIDNLKDDRKRGKLVQYGSVTSSGSAEKGDPTKKRRVERSRKMAEAKERNLTPAIPSDMQSVLKRCENLEKEVRSLKLNLSFMNRKDSEQSKQIEELQKQNEDLTDEKERLLEEIERIVSETG